MPLGRGNHEIKFSMDVSGSNAYNGPIVPSVEVGTSTFPFSPSSGLEYRPVGESILYRVDRVSFRDGEATR